MIRQATPESIESLRRAATGTDLEFDRALSDVGILPPVDLDEIRDCLLDESSVIVAETNRDGHRLLSLHNRYGVVAWIHHDGRVVRLQQQLATAG